MAVVAVGGNLAMLIVLAAGNLAAGTLAAGTLAEGLWGDLLATALAAVGGGGFIALVYRFLGLGRWQSAPGRSGLTAAPKPPASRGSILDLAVPDKALRGKLNTSISY